MSNCREIAFVLVWSAVIVAVGLTPFIVCARATPEGWVWRGWVCLPWDQDSYLTWSYQAYEGNLLFDMKYTTEPQEKIHFRPLMLLMGVTARCSGLSLTRVFHVYTALIGYMVLVASYGLCRLVFPASGRRLLAFALISFSAGVSWLLPAGYLGYINSTFRILPVDRWIPEGNVFLTIMSNANYAAATLGMVLSILFFLLAARRRSHLYSFLSGLSCAALVLVHPPDAVTVFLVISLFSVIRYFSGRKGERRFRLVSYGVYGLITLAALLYQYWIFSSETTFAEWAKMTKIVSTSPYSFVIGYGFLFIMALYGAYRMFADPGDGALIVLSWLVIGFLLYYFPVTFQARVIMGYHIPVAIAAAYGFWSALENIRVRYRLIFLAAFALPAVYPLAMFLTQQGFRISIPAAGEALGCLAPVLGAVLCGALACIAGDRRRNMLLIAVAFFLLTIPSSVRTVINFSVSPPLMREGYYIEKGEVDAVSRLGEMSTSADIILSSQDIGSYIPGHIGCYVYIGHGSETIDLERKKIELRKFLDSATGHAWRRAFLSGNGIDYVYVGRYERRLKKAEGDGFVDFDPSTAPYLERVYSRDGVEIFKVIGSNSNGVVREEE